MRHDVYQAIKQFTDSIDISSFSKYEQRRMLFIIEKLYLVISLINVDYLLF